VLADTALKMAQHLHLHNVNSGVSLFLALSQLRALVMSHYDVMEFAR
jgi:hypothetical protein